MNYLKSVQILMPHTELETWMHLCNRESLCL